jgi:glycosyltransferase involved in cell wall biosynthesis
MTALTTRAIRSVILGAMPSQTRPALMHRRRLPAEAQTVARSLAGLADLPTIVALGPWDDPVHAYQLAAAVTSLQRTCPVQLVLLGNGVYRTTTARYMINHGVSTRVHLEQSVSPHRRSELLAAADVVVPSAEADSRTLLEVLAMGRVVVAPASAVSARLLMPSSAGLIYRSGDVAGMAQALLRLLTKPGLRQGMATRATQVARRQHLQRVTWQQYDEGKIHA